MADPRTAVDNALSQTKEYTASKDGWTKVVDADDCSIFSRPIQGQAIDMFKAEGIVNGPPEQVYKTLWEADEAKWKTVDNTLAEWKIIESLDANTRVVHQVNTLPWPLWARDTCFVQKASGDGGSFYIVGTSIEHPNAPKNDAKYVRALANLSAFVFEPTSDGKTKMTRIIQLDPAGAIPATVVNSNAKKCHSTILYLRSQFK
eukprot:TRINITY_DN47_c0_g1_i1.p1 TRINITY_DN47_c0_g1~~TRINITY_DN47_c0_g1_i1.p1  ORF type:complete len:219 (-),score=53.58 TRINITY_DN47_c0_g1_i1:41-649(-)